MDIKKEITILCLHGHLGMGDSMSVFVEYLTSRGFNVIAPDLRGYGKFRIDRQVCLLEAG